MMAQVVPSEYGARLPLLFPFSLGYWRDGDVSSVPTLPQLARSASKSASALVLRLAGRQTAYHRLQQLQPGAATRYCCSMRSQGSVNAASQQAHTTLQNPHCGKQTYGKQD